MDQDDHQSSASRFQASSCSASTQMFIGARSSFSEASGGSAVPESPGIPEDFEVQQPKSRSAKKRRISGGQAIDEQADPVAALACVRKWVMENIRDRIAFNQVTVRYRVPEFPHSSVTFNIILGSCILASPKVLQGSLGDSTCPTQCSQPCPAPANRNLTGLTWFPIVLIYIK